MTMRSWIRNLFAHPATRTNRKAPRRTQLTLEALEDRMVPTTFGTLDQAFGTGGLVTNSSLQVVQSGNGYGDGRGGAGSASSEGVAVQADGKIVVAGTTRTTSGGNDFFVARYTANGVLDTQFGTNGVVTTGFGSYTNPFSQATIPTDDQAASVTIAPNGDILVAGTSLNTRDGVVAHSFALAAYKADGTLDTHFGGTGLVTTGFGSYTDPFSQATVPTDDQAASVTIAPNGDILVAGTSTDKPFTTPDGNGGVANSFALAAYRADGTLDTHFGGTGLVTTGFGSYTNPNSQATIPTNDQAASVTIAPNGDILVAGTSTDKPFTGRGFVGLASSFALAAYRADGTLDTHFGGTGLVTTGFGSYTNPNSQATIPTNDQAASVTIAPNGDIIVVGTSGGVTNSFALAAYRADGTLDTHFGGTGLVTTGFGSYTNPNSQATIPTNDQAASVTIAPNGDILVAGTSTDKPFTVPGGAGFAHSFALAAYRANGALDSTFGSNGLVTTGFGSYTDPDSLTTIPTNDQAASMAIAPNGDLIVAGTSSGSSRNALALAAYNARAADVLNAMATPVTTAVYGTTFSTEVATFLDSNPNATTADFPLGNVTINWGDGSAPSAATRVTEVRSNFHVFGSHTYNAAGTTANPLTVTITDVGGDVSNTTSYTPTVAQAQATIHVTGYAVTYDGQVHLATGTATGITFPTVPMSPSPPPSRLPPPPPSAAGPENLSGYLDLSGTAHTNAGTPTDTWTFHDPNGNYADATGTVSDHISQAQATISVTGYTVTYDGAVHSATGTATGIALSGGGWGAGGWGAGGWGAGGSSGAGGGGGGHSGAGGAPTSVDLSAYLNLSATAHTNAGSYADTWTFHDPNGNYQDASGPVSDTIARATLPVSVTSDLMLANTKPGEHEGQDDRHLTVPPPLTGTLSGNPFTGSVTFTDHGNTLTVTLSSAVTANSPVGTYPIFATVTGSATALANYLPPAAGNLYVVTLGHDAQSGAKTVSFWDSKGNAAAVKADLSNLDALNLRNDNGSAFDPTTAAQLQNWLKSDTDSIVKALSVQMAVMELNILNGNASNNDIVYAGNLLQFASTSFSTTGLDGGGFITVGNLMTLANNALATYTATKHGDNDDNPLARYLDTLEDALEAANNNTSFVQQTSAPSHVGL